jgi:TRAP-type C4-dicarboxylate transport system permease small subunit
MKFLKLLDKHIEEWILIGTYTAMLVIATAQIFFRYVVNVSISWSQDLLTYMLIWSVFIGISLTVRERKHIKVELAFVILPEKYQFYLKVLSNLVFMVFCGIFTYYSSLKIYKLMFINPQISESTGLSMWMIQIAVPIGFILSIYRLVADTRLLFKERKN